MQSGSLDLAISTAIRQGVKISKSSIAELDQMFRAVFMLVGLRPQFVPNELETMFLYQFVQDNYANHTTDEIVLAFKEVAKGSLKDAEGKSIELFDYFTPIFFGKVMAAYRLWATDIGNKIADEDFTKKLMLQEENKKQGEIDWRQVVEQDYQFFLNNNDSHGTYPEEHYKLLVEDDFIKEDFWKKKVQSVRNSVMQDLNTQLVMVQNSKGFKNDNTSLVKKHNEIRGLMNRYKSGDGDQDFVLMAKQKVVLAFFKYNRDLGNKNIYLEK